MDKLCHPICLHPLFYLLSPFCTCVLSCLSFHDVAVNSPNASTLSQSAAFKVDKDKKPFGMVCLLTCRHDQALHGNFSQIRSSSGSGYSPFPIEPFAHIVLIKSCILFSGLYFYFQNKQTKSSNASHHCMLPTLAFFLLDFRQSRTSRLRKNKAGRIGGGR